MSRWVFRIVCAGLMLPVGTATALPVLNFDQSLGGTGVNMGQTVGWAFNVLEPVTVTHLAWFDQDQDGLSTSHHVGLWDPAGQLLSEATVPAGVAAPLDGIWRLVDIPHITLEVGTGYVIGGTNTDNSTDRLAAGLFPIDLVPQLEHVATRYSTFSAVLILPELSNPATSQVGFYGPGFSIVPEPLTGVLLLCGMVGLARRTRGA